MSRTAFVLPPVLIVALAVGLEARGAGQTTQKPAAPAPAAAPAGPVIVMETVKGTIEFELFPEDAPKTVAHFLALVRRNFYNGHRFHRVVPKFVIQVGDPQTRNMTRRADWGRGSRSGSGKPVGVAEFSKKRTHVRGAVAMAHAGDAAKADSQFYITLAAQPALDGKYAVIGQVTSGIEVALKIEETDILRKMYVKAGAAGSKP